MTLHHYDGFHSDLAWHGRRPEPLRRPYADAEKVTLPSINEAFPELQLRAHLDASRRTEQPISSPRGGPGRRLVTPPEYIHSPSGSKRRRLSWECEREYERAGQTPRLYSAQQQSTYQPQSSSAGPSLASEAWTNPNGRTSYVTRSPPPLPSLATTGGYERPERRPTLPSLPLPNARRNVMEMQEIRSHSVDGYSQESLRRPSFTYGTDYRRESGASAYRPENASHGFLHGTRHHSLSLGPTGSLDRMPFSIGPLGHPYHDSYVRMGDPRNEMAGDSRQRRRRGNLPKETTDKLRSWFVAHVEHPYPSEDEKQELMRQTGLQMNQISNWFINARRRQLPNYRNKAQAEGDGTGGRCGDTGKMQSPTEVHSYQFGNNHSTTHLSDGEANNHEDVELEHLERRRGTKTDRNSL
ncbi:hypothetical protein DL766_004504 [Monosporascus sp. MC13-8B]|uniref:Homeobox domain-containing protein n=1 Tax=Monosporascus cannonballus TaxID=155416 RepID=A0ABY0H4D9_9PEZI|nr:hypothetical protein DL763_011359 [Monosporascus cannonballus]RYO84542.1 hypothetical protein DL762_005648 [Monosporascus cannonballus]RYP31196.1 hypothetical protein DL766_004504 [Monosporascus sp. MC13-8B]